MKKSFSRIKSGATIPAYVDTSEVKFIDAIHEILKCELCWGAAYVVTKPNVTFTTLVFGDKDTTVFEGTDEELDFIERMCLAYRDNKLTAIQNFFFTEMGIPLTEHRYQTADILDLYDVSLSGDITSPELIELLDAFELTGPFDQPAKPPTVSDATLNLYKQLEDGDGAKAILASAILQSGFGTQV